MPALEIEDESKTPSPVNIFFGGSRYIVWLKAYLSLTLSNYYMKNPLSLILDMFYKDIQ